MNLWANVPVNFVLFESLGPNLVPSCRTDGYLPFFRQAKDHSNTFQISSFVSCSQIYLLWITVNGTLSSKVLQKGTLIVMKSRLAFLMVPSTGTASPCKPMAIVPSTGKPSMAQMWLSAWQSLEPALGLQACAASALESKLGNHSWGSKKGYQLSILLLVLGSFKGTFAQ